MSKINLLQPGESFEMGDEALKLEDLTLVEEDPEDTLRELDKLKAWYECEHEQSDEYQNVLDLLEKMTILQDVDPSVDLKVIHWVKDAVSTPNVTPNRLMQNAYGALVARCKNPTFFSMGKTFDSMQLLYERGQSESPPPQEITSTMNEETSAALKTKRIRTHADKYDSGFPIYIHHRRRAM